MREGLSDEKMSELVTSFEKRVKESDANNEIDVANRLSDFAKGIKTTFGEYIPSDCKEDNIVVPHHRPEVTSALLAMGFRQDDLPSKAPPMTVEQIEFLTALHEAEHATQRDDRHPVAKPDYPGQLVSQAIETDADTAVMKVLDDIHCDKAKEYWLQWRNVDSFADGMSGDDSHDTATFLRVMESTGQQIDLEKFQREKGELVDKIRCKFPAVFTIPVKTGDIMKAAADMIEDNDKYGFAAPLSPFQKAELQQYLDDAKALGFTPTEGYIERAKALAPATQPAPATRPAESRPAV
jgi:hypothetical protein